MRPSQESAEQLSKGQRGGGREECHSPPPKRQLASTGPQNSARTSSWKGLQMARYTCHRDITIRAVMLGDSRHRGSIAARPAAGRQVLHPTSVCRWLHHARLRLTVALTPRPHSSTRSYASAVVGYSLQHGTARAVVVWAGPLVRPEAQASTPMQHRSCRQVGSRVGGVAAASAASVQQTRSRQHGVGGMQLQWRYASRSPRPHRAGQQKGRSPAVLRHRRHAAL